MNEHLWGSKVPYIKMPIVHSQLKTNCVKYFQFIAFRSRPLVLDLELMSQQHLLQGGGKSVVSYIT